MARRNAVMPSSTIPKAAPAPTSSEEPGLFDLDPELMASISEGLRRLSLGLTAALLAARAYFPSEAISESDSGRGLGWVLAMLVAAGIGLASLWVSGKVRLRLSRVDAAVLILILLVGASSIQAPERRIGINLAWEWGGLGVAYFLLRTLPRSRRESVALLGVLAATAVAVAAYGLYQAGVELPRIRQAFRNNPREIMLQAGEDPNNPIAFLGFKRRLLDSKEPFSTFALANSLAGYLVGAAALIVAVIAENLRTAKVGSPRWRSLLLASPPLLLLLVCLLLTKSRSAYLGLIAATAFVAFRSRKGLSLRTLGIVLVVSVGIILALVVAATAAGQLDKQVLTESTKSLRYRWEYWQGAWGVITEKSTRFWSGWGPGNFKGPYLRHKLAVSSEEIADPHNAILDVWSTAGFPAAFALLVALGIGLRALWRRSDEASDGTGNDTESRPGWFVLAGGLGGLVIVWVLGTLDPVTGGEMLTRWLVLASAWLLAASLGYPLWRRCPIPAWAAGAGVLALSINLLAAGGIGIPAVASMLWSLLALGLNLRDDRPDGRLRAVGGRFAAFGLLAAWAMIVGLFIGAVRPHWQAEALLAEGRWKVDGPSPDLEEADSLFIRASDLDRFAVEPYLARANVTFLAWRELGGLPGDQAWNQIDGDLRKAIAPPRNPDSMAVESRRAAIAQAILGRGPLNRTATQRLLTDRVNAAARCVALYPTSAGLRAELAESLAARAQWKEAAREGNEALRLHELTPHEDRKLAPAVVKRLQENIPAWEAKVR